GGTGRGRRPVLAARRTRPAGTGPGRAGPAGGGRGRGAGGAGAHGGTRGDPRRRFRRRAAGGGTVPLRLHERTPARPVPLALNRRSAPRAARALSFPPTGAP